MLLIDASIQLDEIITKNIQAGFYNGRTVPCLIYEGEYIKEVNKNTKYKLNGLKEIVEEVITRKDMIRENHYRVF